MKNTFENEVVYITGASAGIGYATAQLCLQYGATVVITGRNKDNLCLLYTSPSPRDRG